MLTNANGPAAKMPYPLLSVSRFRRITDQDEASASPCPRLGPVYLNGRQPSSTSTVTL